MLDGDLMPLFQEEFSCFQSPDKSQGQDEDQGINPFQFGQVRIFKIEASTFTTPKENFNTPSFAIKRITMSQPAVADQD